MKGAVIQVRNLTSRDLRDGPVTVVTRIASSFQVSRKRRYTGWTYFARNRVEFAQTGGVRTYLFLADVIRDLSTR